MPRKRSKQKRRRPGYVRPSRAKAKTGWTLRQLAALVGLAPRSMKYYLESGVLPKPPFKGPATRYLRPHLVRLVVARQMLAAEKELTLVEIRRRLESLSAAEIDALATKSLPPGPLAAALGIVPAPAPLPATNAFSASGVLKAGVPRWTRVEIALGLELHLRDDAGAQVIELARRIQNVASTGG